MAEHLYGRSDRHIVLYEKKAEECRQRAERSLNSFDEEAWLRLADDWAKMAQEIERRLRQE